MNSFGTASLKYPLCDPRSTIEDRIRFRREALPLLSRVNSFYCPIGRYSFKGWLLLPRQDYNNLDPYSTSLQLDIDEPRNPDNVATLKNLSIVQAHCVTRGLSSDPAALYLIEVTDARGILYNDWFQSPTNSMYNIRVPAYPQTFHPASMNSGTAWTWSTVLQDLWQQMPLLGTWPGLPYFPSGTPEGFWFTGVSAWCSLCDVLSHIGMTVACDLTQANPYTIVSTGVDDVVFTRLQTRYIQQNRLEDDLEWLDRGAGRVPKTIKMLFRRRNSIYGTEETVRSDSPYQWDMSSVYTISINAPATFASAVGTHYIWSDFTVRYDMDGNPSADDITTATTIAQERVSQYFDRIYSRTSGFMTQTYTGALPFTTGSQVDGVKWYHGKYLRDGKDYNGWCTQLVRGNSPPWPNIYE